MMRLLSAIGKGKYMHQMLQLSRQMSLLLGSCWEHLTACFGPFYWLNGQFGDRKKKQLNRTINSRK